MWLTKYHWQSLLRLLLQPLYSPSWIKKIKVKDKATGKIDSLPMMCQHCEQPPCVDVCPTNASMRREDGVVLVDKHLASYKSPKITPSPLTASAQAGTPPLSTR
jgi:flavoprotein